VKAPCCNNSAGQVFQQGTDFRRYPSDPVPPATFRQQGFDIMSECDDGGDKSALARERTHPPQLVQSGNDQGLAARRNPALVEIIDGKRMDRQRAGARKRPHILDQARFTAGVVSLYETVLNEPVPEKMIRLIEEIGKQERKS
jgi:hypothetical protein